MGLVQGEVPEGVDRVPAAGKRYARAHRLSATERLSNR